MSDTGTKPEAPDLAPAAVPAVTLAVTRLRLTNFRSYECGELDVAVAPVVLAGANGTGKTNLLEAISFLSPGRGLRGARLNDVQRKAPQEPVEGALWAVAATLTRPGGAWDIGTGLAPMGPNGGERRLLHLNGAPAETSTDIAELLPMLWLTPAMDRLFLESAGGRRRFLDRLVLGLDSGHARCAARYEHAARERLRVLREDGRQPVWLDGLEEAMAETGAALTQARLTTVERLNAELSTRGAAGAFPCAHLALEDAGGIDPQALRALFAATRTRDAEAGRTTAGPQRADLVVRHTQKRADARDCSTGEQKALLVSIVLADAWLQRHRSEGQAPLLLLDEIAAHLDARRRAALFEEILALGAQAWMTGTDLSLFAALAGRAQRFAVSASQFLREK